MDGNYLGSCFRVLSAIAKKESQSLPLFGRFMQYSQCLFVERTSSESRKAIFSDIQQRVNDFTKATDDSVPPILIFPEGTVSNGRAILQFKNGAFDTLTPITIFSMRYECIATLTKVRSFIWPRMKLMDSFSFSSYCA